MTYTLGAYSIGVYSLPMLVAAVAATAFTALSFGREGFNRQTGALAVLHGVLVVWLIGTGLMIAAADASVAERWARIATMGIALIGPAIYGFTIEILYLPRRRIASLFVVIGLAFVAVVSFTELLVSGVRLRSWGYYPTYGALGVPFILFHLVASGLASLELRRRAGIVEAGADRDRIRMLERSFGTGALGAVDFLPVYGVPIYPFGAVAALGAVLLKARMAGRYRLVDLTPAFAAEQIVSTMADPLLVVDTSGRIRAVNHAARNIFGYPKSGLVGAPVARLVEADSEHANALREVLEMDSVRDREILLRTASGDPLDVSVSASGIADTGSRRVGSVLIARDIRERKEADRLLREREERFRSLIENIWDGIVVLDRDGRIAFASSSLTRITGHLAEERLGGSLFDLMHPEEVGELGELWQRIAAAPGSTATKELRIRHRDGRWRTIEATATNLLAHPAVAGVIVACHDITERKATEAALLDSHERLRRVEKLEAVGRLAGGVAHDFNNLLTIVIGNAKMALDGPANEEEMRSALTEINGAAERASDLTRQLLAYGRKQVLQPRAVNVNAELFALEADLRRRLGGEIRVELILQPGIGHVWADPEQLQQVVLTLAGNAREAMPDGGVFSILTQEVALAPDSTLVEGGTAPGDYVRLALRDTGGGIPEDELSLIFEPFFTTKERTRGSGLGLATVYGIVRQSGGTVEVESDLGAGSTFSVYLPLARSATDAARTATRHHHAAPRATILVVEDSDALRTLARRVLHRHGYVVAEAADGAEALRILTEWATPIDLVVSDVIMPVMGGREMAERLRELRPGLPVLFMSGYTDDDYLNLGIGQGTPFLPKPFSPEQLAVAVRTLLESSVRGADGGLPALPDP